MGRGFTSFTKGKCDEVGDGWRIPHILMIFDDCIGLYSRKRSCGSPGTWQEEEEPVDLSGEQESILRSQSSAIPYPGT